MGSFPSANPSLPTSVPGVYVPESGLGPTLPVAINQGGTGQTTAAAALAALGGAATGNHAFKQGTGAGNYTTTSNTFVAIDSGHLDAAIVVPSGAIALAVFMAAFLNANLQSTDIGIAIDGAVQAFTFVGGNNTNYLPVSVFALFVGDGSSHTFSPQWQNGTGSNTANIWNVTGSAIPQHAVIVLSAN